MTKLVVGNWKMHGDAAMAHALAEAVAQCAAHAPGVTAVLCPPAVLAVQLRGWLIGSKVHVGGQDCHAQMSGAFTGDISAAMLAEAGCRYVIIGHSERRQFHRETNADVRQKAGRAIEAGLIPIVCVGETLQQRDGGQAGDVVAAQVRESLPEQAKKGNFALAYEPVWAIGSGKTPTPDDIARMHALILEVAAGQTGLAGEDITVLYGGSVKADNAGQIMAIPGVSGVLVGGASLKAEELVSILRAAQAAAQDLS